MDEYFKTNIKNGVYPFGDRQSQRYKIIDEIMTRLLHLEFLPLIEKIVGKNGVDEIIELDLNESELVEFNKSVDAVRSMNSTLSIHT